MALSFKEIRKIQIELRQIQQKMKDKNLRFKEIRALNCRDSVVQTECHCENKNFC